MTNEYKIEYIQRKNDVMDFLNQSIQVMEALEKKDEADNLRVFYNNVEKNVFSIVVVGEFSAGKSTFLNAMMHKKALPTFSTETTATVNFLRHVTCAPNGEAGIVYYREPKGSTEVLENLDSATIERVVSTRGDKENDRVATRVDHVDLFFDSDFLTDGVTLVDSPGLNGTADHHREITEEQICRSSACIFLFNAEQPGSKSNFDFLRELKSRNSNIFFVLNKINTIKTAEGETVEGIVNHIARIYHEQFPEETQIPHIWPISANEALTARDLNIKSILDIWGNERSIDTPEERERLEKKSRMKNFEDHLWNYLTNGARARDQLLSPLGSTLKALSAQKEDLKTQIEMLEQESGSEELEQQKVILEGKIAELQTRRMEASRQLKGQMRETLDDLQNQAKTECGQLQEKIKGELKRKDSPEDLQQYSTKLGDKLQREYGRIAAELDEQLRRELLDMAYTEFMDHAEELAEKLDGAGSPVKLGIDPKNFQIESISRGLDLGEFDKKCEALEKRVEELQEKSEQLKDDFIAARANERDLQEAQKWLKQLQENREEFKAAFKIPEVNKTKKTEMEERGRNGIFGKIANVFVGGRLEQVEKEETDSAAHDAAIKDRDEILNDKDKVIREAEAAVNEAKARVHETRSEVLDARQQREAIRLEKALRKLEETRENQAKEIKEANSRTLNRLQDELLGKVEDCSYYVVSMVNSYLGERQKSYIQMVQDLVNISLNEELSKKKSELEKLIQTIQSKGEEREKALNDAKINLEKTKKLMDQGALLQVQLESGESAKIDMEKV
ncbi:dynamin family protein [Faecalibacterium sp. PGM34]